MRKFNENNYLLLRSVFDKGDPIFRGLESKEPRYLQRKKRPEEDTAPFLYNDTGTKQFLLKCFPRLAVRDRDHVHQAAFWYEIIVLYWRMGWSNRLIYEEACDERRGHEFSISRIDYTVQQIRRKIKGLRRNGKPYSTRPSGRPKKIHDPQKNESSRHPTLKRTILTPQQVAAIAARLEEPYATLVIFTCRNRASNWRGHRNQLV